MKREILDGQKFGEWTVLRYAGNRKQLCLCSCGNVQEVDTSSLKSGRSQHCSDKVKHTNISEDKSKSRSSDKSSDKSFKDLTGQHFGVLTPIEYMGNSKWKCKCICGAEVTLLSKNIRNHDHAKCTHKPKKQTEVAEVAELKKDSLIGKYVGDLSVIKKTDKDRYMCRCICGAEKEVRGYSLRKALKNNSGYKCRHINIIGKRFGSLVVEKRLPNQICRCRCDCGNEKDVWLGNLLNNSTTSCGCAKSPKYSKDEVIEKINTFISTTGEKPFTKDLADILGLGLTTIYEYIEAYELSDYLNTKFGSRAERDIYTYVSSLTTKNIVYHDRTVLSGNELDIYIPELKLAIEYNGSYWHSSIKKEAKYHQNKTIACAKQGIRLVHIFEYEWENADEQVKIKHLLKNILTDNSNKIYARNTNIYTPSIQEVKEFENKYHLQGYASDKVHIGLQYKNELVAIMTFGKPRFDSKYQYELIRLCMKDDVIILGGLQKLFKYFIRTYDPDSIITYVNISKFTGNSYLKLGFKPADTPFTSPNYVWVDSRNNVLKRYMTMKSKLVEQGLGTINETEDEIMIRNNFLKVYDSGNLKLVYNKEEK